ncbi:asparagine synthase (glutamine-hydrolyzing) [Photobacterium arenosum]|uniref:asparagine synthase (glutamine-hydrolyzing) n=1 Tax=Photobacterium arenosum TaxID=2774143 RepID=UPI00288A06B8|nr:asparagine synthase (glutamine-hydrolyzing) [Photobacterium arenosum]
MCGIFGIVDYTKKTDVDFVKQCTDKLHRRGPDNGGYNIVQDEHFNLGFGHRRLSIVDLSENGNQPFEYENLLLVFNGEIYNHKALREELTSLDYKFTSTSDTEVAIKYIHHFGLDKAIEQFNGMFSIGLFDKKTKKLTLVRDRLGVKPLYYYVSNERIVFASETKAILASDSNFSISKKSLALYLKYGYVPTPLTMWNKVKKLENGSYIEFDLLKRDSSQVQYWSYRDKFKSSDVANAIDNLDSIMNESVRLRLDADVEVGCFLSGGYDSSLTAAIMQKQSDKPIKTFTIGFSEDDFDESSYALEIANFLGTQHHHYQCTPDYVKKTVKKLPLIWDDPISDTSVFPTLLVSECARKHVKVAMSSDGGDEVFAGYNVYQKSLRLNKIIKYLPFKNKLGKTLRLLCDSEGFFFSKGSRRIRRISRIIESTNPTDIKRAYQNIFDDQEISKLCNLSFSPSFDCLSGKGELNDMLIDDINNSHVDQLLTKVDRASMYSSLEAREPLLDVNLLEFAASLSNSEKVNDDKGKFILKELAHRYIPKGFLDRPKQGFSIPIKKWLESDLSELIEVYFSEEKLSHGYFNNFLVNDLLSRYKNNEDLNFKQIWTLLSFQIWYEEWSKYNIFDKNNV